MNSRMAERDAVMMNERATKDSGSVNTSRQLEWLEINEKLSFAIKTHENEGFFIVQWMNLTSNAYWCI